MVADAGHYPHSQQADVVNALLVDFLQGVAHHG
jgi:pimeloyl-ACP methyl ester carboxylesterase